ncbi:YcjF family protein [Tautonia marina]|uniref:YcjF family protein n=1 Tax=Tautonia marina TaxID=2653855 RepID=UPI001260F779|nr:YcjF family protein [Tautonia marina]
MSHPSGYGPSSGIPGGEEQERGPGPAPETRSEPTSTPTPELEPARERRSRPVDSGIPVPVLDESRVGPPRMFLEDLPPIDDDEPILEERDRPWVDRGTGALIVVLVTAVLLLVVASQAASFLAALAVWPPVVQAIGYGVAAVLVGMFAIAAVGLIWKYFTLPISPGVRVDRADSLSHRRSVQAQARRNRAIAKRQLLTFLEGYPTDPRHTRVLVSIAGPEAAQRLLIQRTRLLSHDAATDDDWVREFEARFLEPLDEMARTLVKRQAVAVGVKTAIVPSGFLDGLIVVANAYQLIGSLCRLYHLRADNWSTIKITAHVFGNTFVAARLEEFTDQAADASFDQMHDLIHSQVARGVLSRLSSGVTQGTVNGLLLRRFGRYAIRALRPIRG